MKKFIIIGIIVSFAVLISACNTVTNKKQQCLLNANGTCITKIEKFNKTSSNTWESVKQQCGGQKNMPTGKDLANIASYLYDTNIKAGQNKIAKINNTKSKPFSDKVQSTSDKLGFLVISGDEASDDGMLVRQFNKNYTSGEDATAYSKYYRGTDIVTVCVAH